MTPEELIEKTTVQCDSLRTLVQQQTTLLADFDRRLGQILQQLRKNIEVRDTEFADNFNQFAQDLRDTLNKREPVWTKLRAQIRQVPSKQWTADLSLSAKGLNIRAKTLSRACDEFETEYDQFCKNYKSFTAAKLNVWLLTSCQTDIANLTGKIVFLAREISRKTDSYRSSYAK
jgi:hypothetical protein